MTNLIVNNAYRILGLDGSSNQKNILKRSKEIINRLKIDDYPEYSLDINLPEKFRTEELVNDALKKLQNMKKNLNEYFFWFNIADKVDENAFEHLQYGDATSYDEAIQIWKNASNTENSTGLFYKKNLTLLYCLILLNEKNDIYLKESLSNWKEIIDSDKFWTAFKKSYAVNTDQTINSDIISDFRANIVKHISDIYHDLYLQHGSKKYIKDFQDTFGILGDKTEENLLKPIHQSIYDIIKKLEKISLDKNDNIDEDEITETDNMCDNCGKSASKYNKKYDDDSILCEECYLYVGKEWKKRIKDEETIEGSTKIILKIKRITTKLELQLDQLREIGLYDDEQSKVVRDHAAEAIRRISIMIHNDALMKAKSIELIDLAKKIAGTESVKEKLQLDLKTIEGYIETDQESTLSFDMGGFLRKKELKVTNDFVEYKRKKIYYKDAISVALYNDGDDYTFLINSYKDKMKIKFTIVENINKVYAHMQNIIEPILVEKLVKLIFEEDTAISIGSINFDKNGYHSSKMFRVKSVLWTDPINRPTINAGTVTLHEFSEHTVDGDLYKEFTTIPMKNLNAIIIPELVESCFHEYNARNQK
jgi:hypothetical protein